MQILNLVRAIVVTLLSAVIGPFDRDRRVEAMPVTLTNQAKELAALTWLRGLRESPLNFTSKTKKIVKRQTSEQNFTTDSSQTAAAAAVAAAAAGNDDWDSDDAGNLGLVTGV